MFQRFSNPLKVGEVSKQANISVSTLQYYEKIGLLEKPLRSRKDYRLYDQNALERLDFIKKGKTLGFKLDEIRQIIDESKSGNCPCDNVKNIVHKRLEEVDEKIAQMKQFRNDLTNVVKDWKLKKPSDSVVCNLIEESDIDF